jgi:transcriptional regulator with XRE-family HTH domain
MTWKVYLGDRVRTLRLEQGLTQRRLGAQAGRDAPWIASVEDGTVDPDPTIPEVYALARALVTTLHDLLPGEQNV